MPPRKGRNATQSIQAKKCSTLLEDDDLDTRCSEPPTHGTPVERCRVHHKQYLLMTKKYKTAQRFVDETLAGSTIPSKEEVAGYTDIHEILEKGHLMKRYIRAIREERTGREIHHRRFFSRDIRDCLEARALALHLQSHPAKDWVHDFQSEPINPSYRPSDKERLLYAMEFLVDPESFVKSTLPTGKEAPSLRTTSIFIKALTQYTRRTIFHDPKLFLTSLDKVSFKDFVMDDEFDTDDILRFEVLFQKRLEIGLRWWKDSLVETVAMEDNPDSSTAVANMGSIG
ncbi:hypothetical protein C8J56DRAFT_1171996 [Mycena floridula]|nr:hypothetical protein C8J56DRAFT_1171996 [Mycena floridula]